VRGSDIRLMRKYPAVRRWQNRLFERADAVIAVSQSLLQDVEKCERSVRDKAQVIPTGLDRFWFDDPALPLAGKERYVLFVGRFHIIKGADLLLRAWSLLQEQASGITLWLVGEGNELSSLRSLSQQVGVGNSVRFKGYTTQAELSSLYQGAEMVIVPSRNEGLPRVALEAGACGAIRVATRVGGTPETILDGVTGFLVDPESPEALAQGILRALCQPASEKQRMSMATRAHIQRHFSRETMLARYEHVFQSLLQKRTA
jgi:glycosyltransferase involved in cell wall biosynthesis